MVMSLENGSNRTSIGKIDAFIVSDSPETVIREMAHSIFVVLRFVAGNHEGRS